jgi:SAM-dependent methyltransferase
MTKHFSEACERNREPILSVLRGLLAQATSVLEIGSGTGQHAVYFAAALPHLTWQTSDLPANHASIHAWLREEPPGNVLPPLALDVAGNDWPPGPFDAVFTANTCHIMAWDEVCAMFAGVGRVLRRDGVFCVYGPFNVGGKFTSESNALFDLSLKAQGEHMGIRDVEEVDRIAREEGLNLLADHAMPAHNRLLVWRK